MSLEVRDLAGGYGLKPVVEAVTLTVAAGQWLSCVGPNGSGKSTLLRLLMGLIPPTQGAILWAGSPLTPTLRTRALAFLPQQPRIPSGITVRQLVSLGRLPHQPWWQWQLTAADREAVEQALQLTQLLPLADRWVESLSGGERQRAFVAIAIAQASQVILLDEPTTFLDVRYQLELLELLKHLNQTQGLTVITVLHDLNLAARYSDQIAVLQAGRLHAWGTPIQVLTADVLAAVFGLEIERLDTQVGLQIVPLRSRSGPIPALASQSG